MDSDVRPCAQVFEVAVTVGRYSLALRDLLDDLGLQRVVGVPRQRLVAMVLPVLEGVVLRDGLLHALFDLAQVVVGEGLGDQEVVVEAVVRRRPYGQLGFGEHLRHHVRHHVGGGVAYASSELCQLRVLLQYHKIGPFLFLPPLQKGG